MIVAMAQDVRVILIKLADRLHNMRTIEYLGKQKQVQKARETLEVYAPLAHRLGIHTVKWELEDLSFQTLHPRKYAEIKAMVPTGAGRPGGARSTRPGRSLAIELEKVDIPAGDLRPREALLLDLRQDGEDGKEFNEIYDLTAMRVIVERDGEEGKRDCYGALGVIHSLWKPLPGRFKDFMAMPKLNRYRSLHTTVIGPEGDAARDPGPHPRDARGGRVRRRRALAVQGSEGGEGRTPSGSWVKQLIDWQGEEHDPREFMRTFRRSSSTTRSTSSRRRAR